MTDALSLTLGQRWGRDFTASIVVFLVAMPLCMGIAIASGVPAEKGLITGIIGGIIVGLFAGSPLQVSGPAAGLAVIVFEIVREHGLLALAPILMVAGLIQLGAGWLRLGGWFRAISPAVVHGMLAGIGLLIVVGQYHVLFDEAPLASGLDNLAAMPGRLIGLRPDGSGALPAFMIGIVTIAAMIGWERLRPQRLRLVPGALVAIIVGTLSAMLFSLDVARVDVPESLAAAVILPTSETFASMLSPGLLASALAIAFIASAETLLSAAAVDRMHDGVRTDYNKELRAQGIGNMLCGAAGSIPMTGVIVRSSANVQAGAVSRWSAVLHGVWILGAVALLPWMLREIPMAALAGILVVTGWRLVSLSHVRHLFRNYGLMPALIWVGTFASVVATDLLTGVLVGLALSLLEILPHFRTLRLRIDDEQAAPTDGLDERRISLSGAATFVALPKTSTLLDGVGRDEAVELDLRKVGHVDHTFAEMLRDWIGRRRRRGLSTRLTGAPDRVGRLLEA